MKKNYFIFLFLFLFCRLNAQVIPNGGFEQWTYNNNNLSFEPTGWTTSNFGLYNDTGVYRSKPARTGNLACGLKTNFVLGTYTVPGMLTTTFASNLQPNGMEGYFKGNLALNDTIIILVEFNKDTNVIADGTLFLTQSESNYVKFTVPIDFFAAGIPDSCTITIMGGGFDIDDTLTNIAIDDLDFVFPVNVKNTVYSASDKLQLYPNPAADILNIACKEDYQSIVIYNTNGQIAGTYQNETSIAISEYASGLYFLQLTDKNNQVVARKSFIKN